VTQNDLMWPLMENETCHGTDRQQPQHQGRDSSYSDFLVTHPSNFVEATDPLEADNLLRTTKSKLGVLHCIEFRKTLYAAQQLCGSARAWWGSYTAALPEDHQVPLGKFHTTFRGHHLSVGLLYRKLKEFLDFEQGNHPLYDYARQFNSLHQYGSHHIYMDAKKAEVFRKGLMVQLQDNLNMFPNLSYNKLASAVINREGSMKACAKAEEKKRKRIMSGSSRSGGSSCATLKYRMVHTPPTGQLRRPQQQY
jgi:hypothetical protein